MKNSSNCNAVKPLTILWHVTRSKIKGMCSKDCNLKNESRSRYDRLARHGSLLQIKAVPGRIGWSFSEITLNAFDLIISLREFI